MVLRCLNLYSYVVHLYYVILRDRILYYFDILRYILLLYISMLHIWGEDTSLTF